MPKISYELPHDAGAKLTDDGASLGKMLGALHKAALAAGRYLLLTIDEIQDADLASVETLATFVHESAQGEAPALLALAGLNETRDLMDRLRTYVHCWNLFDLRFLTFDETIEAIRDPIVAEGTRIDEDVLYLATESGGYPYFIQAYGSAAWSEFEKRGGRAISLADVENSAADVRRNHEMTFYVRPLAKLTARELLVALTLSKLGPGPQNVGEVARELGVTTPDISSTRAALVRKHIVSSPIPGKLEFRIPFTERFLLEHWNDYDTPDLRDSRQELKERKS